MLLLEILPFALMQSMLLHCLCMAGIHELFEASADSRPDNVAIIHPSHDNNTGDVELTYSHVEKKANQLCHYLQNVKGVKPGSVVGILMEQCTSFYITMLAVLKAGAAYVSVDPDLRSDHINYILKDSNTQLVITMRSFGGRVIPALAMDFIYIDAPDEMSCIGAQTTIRPVLEDDFGSDYMCYINYTSSSRGGKPIGIPVIHHAAVHFVQAFHFQYGLEEDERALQGYSTSSNISLSEVWNTFMSCATLVVGSKEIMQSGSDFPRLMQLYGITWFSTTPTHLSTIQEDLETFRMVTVSGETCPLELMRRWATPNRRFINAYGTKATMFASCKECYPEMPRMTVGKPLPNSQCYILDEHMNLLPPGAIGELVIGCASISHGYHNLPPVSVTHKAFKHDSLFRGAHHLYRTGDLARFTPDGEVEHLGRIESQVRVHGRRVSIQKIQSIMCEHPDVTTAILDVRVVNEVKQPVAFIVPTTEKLDVDEVVDYMKTKLPSFMVPTVIEKVTSSLPMLPSGKVELRRLPVTVSSNEGGEKLHKQTMHRHHRSLPTLAWNDLLRDTEKGIQAVDRKSEPKRMGGLVKEDTMVYAFMSVSIALVTLITVACMVELSAVGRIVVGH